MKTTLKNIFDCALPCELEGLINANAPMQTAISEKTAKAVKAGYCKITALPLPDDAGKAYALRKGNKKKKPFPKRRTLAITAACILLTFGILLSVPAIIRLSGGSKPSPDSFPEIPVGEENIIWGIDNKGQSPDSDSTMEGWAEWSGWNVTFSLYDELMKANDNEYIAITVRMNRTGKKDHELSELKEKIDKVVEEMESLDKLRNKLSEFPKVGNELKYGELLYTTGTPSGERWAKEFYDTTVEYYGKDFIDRYIVDGKFLYELLSADLLECESNIGQLSNELVGLREAYGKESANKAATVFSNAGIYTTVRNGHLFLIVQKAALADLKAIDKSCYILGHASRAMFNGEDNIDNEPNEPIPEVAG